MCSDLKCDLTFNLKIKKSSCHGWKHWEPFRWTPVGGKTCWARPALFAMFQEALQIHSSMLESETTLAIICIWIADYMWRWNKGELTESVARTHLSSSQTWCPTPLRTWPDRDHHWCHHRDWPRCMCFSCATSLLFSKLRIKDTCSEEDFWLGRIETKEKNTHIPHVLGKKSVADCLLVEGWPGRRAGAPGIGKTYPFQICIRSFSDMKTNSFFAHLGGFLHVWKIQIQTLHQTCLNWSFDYAKMLQLHLRVSWQNWYLKCRLRNDLGPYCHDDRRAIFNPTPWGAKFITRNDHLGILKVGKSHRSNHMSAIFNNFPKVISGPCLCQIWKSCDETAVLLG